MYAKYTYKTTATQAQVLRDLILILTGTTSTGSLSASCDTANSSIDTTFCTTGNNNDHDSGASANTTQGFRMSVHDDTGTYFYVALTSTATTLQIGMWDAWNSGTHVGTSPGAASTSTMTVPSIGTTGGTIHLWSDGKAVFLQTQGSQTTFPLSVVQITRDDAWRTIANGCKPAVCAGAITSSVAPTGTWVATSPFTLKNINNTPAFVTAPTAYSNTQGPVQDVPAAITLNATYQGRLNTALVAQNVLTPVRAGSSILYAWGYGGSVTQLSEVYFVSGPSVPTIGDEITYNSETYVVLQNALSSWANCKICVRKS